MTVPKTCLNIRARNDFARQNHCVAISQAKVSYKQRIPVNFAGNHSGTEFFIQESNIQAFS